MKKPTLPALGFALVLTGAASGALIISGDPANNPLIDNGGPDGWSGLSLLTTPMGAVDGQNTVQVTDWDFYADNERAAAQPGEHWVQPVIAARPAGSGANDTASVVGIGAPVQVNAAGLHSQPFTLTLGTDTFTVGGPDEYLAGIWQWRDGQDNIDGGIVPFGSGGGGMFQMDLDGTSYVPSLGDPVSAGHASGPGGRSYAFNFQGVGIPEPSGFVLIGLSGLAFLLHRRRSLSPQGG